MNDYERSTIGTNVKTENETSSPFETTQMIQSHDFTTNGFVAYPNQINFSVDTQSKFQNLQKRKRSKIESTN